MGGGLMPNIERFNVQREVPPKPEIAVHGKNVLSITMSWWHVGGLMLAIAAPTLWLIGEIWGLEDLIADLTNRISTIEGRLSAIARAIFSSDTTAN